MNLAAFKVRFPEFLGNDDTNTQAVLDEAALHLDVKVWGKLYDVGHGYMTAHLLALSPFGNTAKLVNQARLSQGESATTYEHHYRRLQRIVTPGQGRNT